MTALGVIVGAAEILTAAFCSGSPGPLFSVASLPP